MTQLDAKVFVPPDTTIWLGKITGEWCTHVCGVKRLQELFSNHDSPEAALQTLLRRSWQLFLDLQGLDLKACPVPNLF
jgi:hypothetical protein